LNRDLVFLNHIKNAIDRIQDYVLSGRESFFQTSLIQDGVIRQLEVIGEAVKRLSVDLRDANPQVPWKRIAGLRDVLIHRYMEVDLDAVWEFTQRDLVGLRKAVAQLLTLSDQE